MTFLRTDVEGSMGLVRALGPAWDDVNGTHLGILRDVVARHDGVCVRTEGDAMFAAFPEAGAAVRAAIDGQRALDAHRWPDGGEVRVRMGLHTGEAHLAGDDYGGFDVNRAARVAAVGHGGQIVLSGTTARARRVRDRPASLLDPRPGTTCAQGRAAPRASVPGRRRRAGGRRSRRCASPSDQSGNLPERLTSFVGRSRDLAELRAPPRLEPRLSP